MFPVFYQRSAVPTTSTVGLILIQSKDHPSSSKLPETKVSGDSSHRSSGSSSHDGGSGGGGSSSSSSSNPSSQDPWWPSGKVHGSAEAFANVGLKKFHAQRAAWRVPKGKRRPPPPPVEYEAVIEGLSAQRVRQFQLPGWIGLTDLIDMYIDLWEMDY